MWTLIKVLCSWRTDLMAFIISSEQWTQLRKVCGIFTHFLSIFGSQTCLFSSAITQLVWPSSAPCLCVCTVHSKAKNGGHVWSLAQLYDTLSFIFRVDFHKDFACSSACHSVHNNLCIDAGRRDSPVSGLTFKLCCAVAVALVALVQRYCCEKRHSRRICE